MIGIIYCNINNKGGQYNMFMKSTLDDLSREGLINNPENVEEKDSANDGRYLYVKNFENGYLRYDVSNFSHEDFMLHYQIKAAIYLRHIRNILLIPIVLVTIGVLIQLAS